MQDRPPTTAAVAEDLRETSPGRPSRARIGGLDLARAAAIIGMLAVHLGPTDAGTTAEYLYAVPHGRASILFMVVAGVGVSLLARSRRRSAAEARAALLWRAALLLPLGLALQLLDHGALVILQVYAVLFLLAIGALGLGDRWLLGLAGASALLGPVAYIWGNMAAPEAFTRDAVALTDSAGEVVHGLLLSGPYPAIVWAAPFLFGMWLGRRDLRAPTLRLALLAGGAATALVAFVVSSGLVALFGEPAGPMGWRDLVVREPHSQMPPWVVGGIGSAALVLGAALVLADLAGRALWPLVATGQLALTVYVGHLLALHLAPDALTSADVGGAALRVVGFTVVAALLATAWRAAFSRGPLEALLRGPWEAVERRRGGPGA